MARYYPERRVLRTVERCWARGEAFLNRITLAGVGGWTPQLNPLYHLGTLSIALLLVLVVTGAYLTVFYRPGADRAYETVAGISASWLGLVMRGVHRYAADGLILVILLHALKMLLSDRFWGARWLAWVSGWALLVLVWIIGVMGYWLVWDQRAQWLTEYGLSLVKGPAAVAFFSPDLASRVFAFFVIILFLHIFLSLLILGGVLVHELRLARARYWAPRWLVVEAVLVLVALALWRPVSSAAPADLSRLVGDLTLDGWYLGFLPLVAQWGGLRFWGAVTLLLGILVTLPWLLAGRSSGPAVVTDDLCTGCALCFQQCPYEAIDMVPAARGRGTGELAVVNPSLCTGCGICVGTCAVAGISLAELPTAQLREQLSRSLARARAAGQAPVVLFTCQRHATLAGLAAGEWRADPAGEHGTVTSVHPNTSAPLLPCTEWGGGNPHPPVPVLACALPCAGMVNPSWARDSLSEGAQTVVILSCPGDDCGFREGPFWLVHRFCHRLSLLRQGVYMVEAAPGDLSGLSHLLSHLVRDRAVGRVRARSLAGYRLPLLEGEEATPSRRSALLRGSLSAVLPGLALVALLFGLSLFADRPATAISSDEGMIRVVMVHPGKFKKPSADLDPEVRAKLPGNVSPEQVLGGERYPVRLRLEVDGALVLERVYRPGGLRREGTVFGLEMEMVPPGQHDLRVLMMDDGETWREVFAGTVTVAPGQVHTLAYDEGQARFTVY